MYKKSAFQGCLCVHIRYVPTSFGEQGQDLQPTFVIDLGFLSAEQALWAIIAAPDVRQTTAASSLGVFCLLHGHVKYTRTLPVRRACSGLLTVQRVGRWEEKHAERALTVQGVGR